jgi:hypothetical protein
MVDQNTTPSAATHIPMDPYKVWTLTAYLLLSAILSCWLVYSLWSAKPKSVTGSAPEPPKPCTNVVLSNLFPDKIMIGTTESHFFMIGCQFNSAMRVKINGSPHSSLFVDDTHIRVPLTTSEVASAGALLVTLTSVEKNEEKEVGHGVLNLVPPTVVWRRGWRFSYEVQLLLMVLFTGAFASSIYALKSLADYQGDNKLYTTWFVFYFIQPFEGAGAAFLLYLLIRAGVLTGTGADVKAENRFGLLAIAALAGAFSDLAFLKLREVFISLLKPTDTRGGKLSLEITTLSLTDGTVGQLYGPLALQTRRGTAPFTWSVTPGLPDGLTLDPSTGTISGTPTAVFDKVTFKFTVTDSSTPSLSASKDLTLQVNATLEQAGTSEDIDGCDVPVEKSTSDEDLPASEGGVAK